MRTIYLDNEFRCHVSNDGTMTSVETDFFDNKCDTFIEGYRFVPSSETWTRHDGVVFQGEMVSPWKDYDKLFNKQIEYERQQLSEYKNEKNELIISYANGVNSI